MGTIRKLLLRVNGQTKETVTVPPGTSDAELRAAVCKRPLVRAALAGKAPKSITFSPDGKTVDINT